MLRAFGTFATGYDILIQMAFYFVLPGFFSKAFDEPQREVRFTP